MTAPELPGMPAPAASKQPRKGSAAWVKQEWAKFRELAAEHGGLTQPAMAAVALGISKPRVNQLMDSGHLRWFEVMGKRFVSCADVEEFAKLERHAGFRYGSASAAA
jgi:predicted XRE-type DNA-binding protein